jgi:hypothetical protein
MASCAEECATASLTAFPIAMNGYDGHAAAVLRDIVSETRRSPTKDRHHGLFGSARRRTTILAVHSEGAFDVRL